MMAAPPILLGCQNFEEIREFTSPYPANGSKREIGYWFNYFWKEAVRCASRHGTDEQKHRVVDIFNEVFENYSYDQRAHLPAATVKGNFGSNPFRVRFILKQLMDLGFTRFAIHSKAGRPAQIQNLSLSFIESIEAEGQPRLPLGFRCDSRAWQDVYRQGAKRKIDVTSTEKREEWGFTKLWHPFNDTFVNSYLWFRRGASEDNCLHATLSVGTTMLATVRFPRIDDCDVEVPSKELKYWTLQECQSFYRKGRIGFAEFGGPQMPWTGTNLYIFKANDLMGIDTEQLQVAEGQVDSHFAERGIEEVPEEKHLAWCEIRRLYYDWPGDADKLYAYQYTPWQFFPSYDAVRNKLGGGLFHAFVLKLNELTAKFPSMPTTGSQDGDKETHLQGYPLDAKAINWNLTPEQVHLEQQPAPVQPQAPQAPLAPQAPPAPEDVLKHFHGAAGKSICPWCKSPNFPPGKFFDKHVKGCLENPANKK